MDEEIERLRKLYILHEMERHQHAAEIVETIVWTILIVAATAVLILLAY